MRNGQGEGCGNGRVNGVAPGQKRIPANVGRVPFLSDDHMALKDLTPGRGGLRQTNENDPERRPSSKRRHW
jgi:hypothetical protein